MLWKIAWKNIIFKPLNSILCISLILFGTGIISIIIILQTQFQQKFENDLRDIDLVVGAKGSPLQLILSAVYHIDAPTGNINYREAQKIMNDSLVEKAIPLSYGDNYKGFRILGTTDAYLNLYGAELEVGNLSEKRMETVIGQNIAKKHKLDIGDEFISTHGESDSGHSHDEKPFTVVGILKENNSLIDNLILTPIESIWEVHADKDHHSANHEHSDQITALLIKCKSKQAILNLPKRINKESSLQAVLPGLELNKLFHLLGIGTRSLQVLAGVIIALSAFSVFLVLLSRLKDRKHELAIMRTVGYKSMDLFSLLIIEGLILSLIGFTIGILFSRIGLYLINLQAESDFNFHFSASFTYGELNLLFFIIALGVVSALFPAWKAMKIDVSETLQKNS